jgi:hypothetical protein
VSDDCHGFTVNYQAATIIYPAFGQNAPLAVREELRRELGADVPLRLIRQLWLDPQLEPHRVSEADIVKSFQLFRMLVLELQNLRRALERAGVPAAGTPDGWLRSYVEMLLALTGDGREKFANFIKPELLKHRYLLAAIQISYMVEITARVDVAVSAGGRA